MCIWFKRSERGRGVGEVVLCGRSISMGRLDSHGLLAQQGLAYGGIGA